MQVMEPLPPTPFGRDDASLTTPDLVMQRNFDTAMPASHPSLNLSPRINQLHSYESAEGRASDSGGGPSGEAAHIDAGSPTTANLFHDLLAHAASGPVLASEDERALARARQLQDKNKRAQQRYRIRQREKLEDYKRQVEELTQTVEALAQGKAALENRTRLLEKVMQMREERGNAAAQQAGPPLAHADGPFANQIVLRAVHEYVAAVCSGAGSLAPSLEDLRHFSAEDLAEVHMQFVNTLSQWLVQPRVSEPGQEPHERLCNLVQTARAVRMLVARVEFKWLRLLESGSDGPGMHPAAWQRALAVIRLTWEQKRALLQSRNRLLARMTAILQRRTEVVKLVSSAQPMFSSAGVTSHAETQAANPHLSDLYDSDAFGASLQEEHQAVVQFLSEVTSDLSPVTPLQEARLIIEAFPCRYEPLSLCNCIATEESQVDSVLPKLQAYLAPAGQGSGGDMQIERLPPDSPFRALLNSAQDIGPAAVGP